ncbi:FeoA family protein [Sphingomonas immobilis]|uniref:FeoA family protein n=1 Tax=Sphingomonas immobilis TaxID=3063997 RepID=A0ABT8ZUW7_9SPHN|nr:FeoA family protein [Sphingomonas sp. CA1-15]MDO7841376.1 FeoA family protein [Sphingomonas sp. CA1-15]
MNVHAPVDTSLSLAALPNGRQATVAGIEWDRLSIPEGRRLRELGFDEGVGVEVLHRASIGKGPIAVRIGRMIVALRRNVAATIHVSLAA